MDSLTYLMMIELILDLSLSRRNFCQKQYISSKFNFHESVFASKKQQNTLLGGCWSQQVNVHTNIRKAFSISVNQVITILST